ncbi:hypothetical protein Pelo_13269 [Pelomyxa schiedti]|nr:hypothetical protein Pelo_13269 [Pelomyxa schiedti]
MIRHIQQLESQAQALAQSQPRRRPGRPRGSTNRNTTPVSTQFVPTTSIGNSGVIPGVSSLFDVTSCTNSNVNSGVATSNATVSGAMTAYTATSGTSAMTSSILTPGAVTSTLTSCAATSCAAPTTNTTLPNDSATTSTIASMTPSFQRGTVQNFFRIDLTGEPANTHLDDSIARSQRALELLTNAPIERPHAISTNRFDKMQSFQNYPRWFYNVYHFDIDWMQQWICSVPWQQWGVLLPDAK